MSPAPRRTLAAASIAYAVQSAALAVILVVTGRHTVSPVVVTLRADDQDVTVLISWVDVGWALVTVLIGGAVVHALVAARTARQTDDRPPPKRSVLLAAGWSQGSAIVVFLVAQLNGIAELTSLVPLYAITAAAVALVAIDPGPATSTWRRPAAWAAVVGIVPWGVIALAQIGATIALGGPDLGVRIVTLLALAVSVLAWITGWRGPTAPARRDVAVMTVAVSVLVWSLAFAG